MNNHRLLSRRTTFSALGLVATTLLAGAAFAQADGGGAPPPPGGAAGGPGGGGRRGGGQRGGQRPITVSHVPVDALDAELTLTADQKTKIAAIQKPIMDMEASMAPKPGEAPARPDREKMTEMRTMSEKADTDITALLTPDQTTKLPDVLKEVQGLQAAGVPPGVLAALALTADEKTSIVDIGSKARRRMMTAMQDATDQDSRMEVMQKGMADTKEKVGAVLTPAQKTTLDAYIKAHPQPMGGYGGGGGRRGGGGGAGAPGGPPPA